MALIERYVDPDVVGGLGDGTSWANAYSSLNAWEAAEQTDLVTDGDSHIVHCRASSGSADTTAVIINGWTTDSTHTLTIQVDQADRHNGKWDVTKYRIFCASTCLDNDIDFVNIYGLQLVDNAGAMDGFAQSGIGCEFAYCIIKDMGDDGIYSNAGTVANKNIYYNNVIYDITDKGMNINSNQGASYVYNNTIVDCGNMGIQTGFNDTTIKNNVVYNCTDDYNGTFQTGTNNAYSEGADPASNGIDISGDAGTDLFIDYGNNDFHCKNTGNLYDAGADLSGDAVFPISDDIDGDARSQWDIGADEYISAGIAMGTLFYYFNRMRHGSGT